ncbi:MAG TPA: secondary thiamine-phosphate synthase enzyme YjbQ [Vicinamibacterales bacterium]|jgi:secondary thiamine-phosphate synthase enzyme
METVAVAPTCRHARIQLLTRRPTEFIDITERIHAFVIGAGIHTGVVNVQSLHTTTAITVQENEPLLLEDFAELLEQAAPAHTDYRHDDLSVRTVNLTFDERRNGHAHCRGLLLGASACLNIVNGRLQLGPWQRVLLVELDGPRTRELSILLMGESAR